MTKIVLFGAGNVATHLFKALHKSKEVEIIQVYNRSNEALAHFSSVPTTTSLADVKPADIYLVSIADDAVRQFIEQIGHSDALIAHTTGSVPLLTTAKRNGVFYPLQTFSKHTALDFSQIPLCLEADTPENFNLLQGIAKSISQKVYALSSDQRKTLHLSAVFACNFTNHLYCIAEKLCIENEIPFEIMHPLLKETAQKVLHNSPKDVQTGPAIRHDKKTIQYHLSQLNSSELKEIYTLLTQSIQAEHGSKL